MKYNRLILPLFILMVLVQLYVPISMIFKQESVIDTGKSFKFKTAPIDPNDPFRGKYITLRFEEESVTVTDLKAWHGVKAGYALISRNNEGFAKIIAVEKDKPNGKDYVEVKINNHFQIGPGKLFFELPFNRFYLEESKAKPAENIYVESQIDSLSTTYALVKIKDGVAVLEDVLIDGISIGELIKNQAIE